MNSSAVRTVVMLPVAIVAILLLGAVAPQADREAGRQPTQNAEGAAPATSNRTFVSRRFNQDDNRDGGGNYALVIKFVPNGKTAEVWQYDRVNNKKYETGGEPKVCCDVVIKKPSEPGKRKVQTAEFKRKSDGSIFGWATLFKNKNQVDEHERLIFRYKLTRDGKVIYDPCADAPNDAVLEEEPVDPANVPYQP